MLPGDFTRLVEVLALVPPRCVAPGLSISALPLCFLVPVGSSRLRIEWSALFATCLVSR